MSTICVVDDESQIRKLCFDVFSTYGHRVMTVPTGDQLISILDREKLDLILMDLKMPGEDGLSLLKRVPLVDGKQVPVVIFSAHVPKELECEAYEAGVIDIIPKTIKIQQFRYKVDKILAYKDHLSGKNEDINWQKKWGKKILVVDDEEAIQKLLSQVFSRKGFKVFTAGDGKEALDLMEKKEPNMVLLDVTLPGMDGLLLLKEIRKHYPETGVVMATAVTDEHISQEAIEIGAYDYVTKPFDLRYLELVVLRRLMLASS